MYILRSFVYSRPTLSKILIFFIKVYIFVDVFALYCCFLLIRHNTLHDGIISI